MTKCDDNEVWLARLHALHQNDALIGRHFFFRRTHQPAGLRSLMGWRMGDTAILANSLPQFQRCCNWSTASFIIKHANKTKDRCRGWLSIKFTFITINYHLQTQNIAHHLVSYVSLANLCIISLLFMIYWRMRSPRWAVCRWFGALGLLPPRSSSLDSTAI